MKKLYSAPLMGIEKFDVESIITTSGGTVAPDYDTSATINNDNGNGYEVVIKSKW